MRKFLISIRKPFDTSKQDAITEWITTEDISMIESTINQKIDLNDAIFNFHTSKNGETELIISFKIKADKILMSPN